MRKHSTAAVIVAGVAVVGAALVGSTPAQAQTFGGNELLGWSIPEAPDTGLSEVTFPITVDTATAHRSGTYFAMQYDFTNQSDVGYTGLQPRPDVDGQERLHGVFSSFIAGTTSLDPNCSDGADGGAGVSCAVDFDATYGHEYDVTVSRTGTDTWTGAVVDTETGQATHIGTYRLPTGSGSLVGGQSGFVEYYDVPSCAAQQRYDVTFGAPRSLGVVGTTTYDHEYGECAGQGHTAVTEDGDGVRITRGSVG
jgi:hypothetical protein